MQPFRSDIDALEARHAALSAEVADRERARDEAAQLLAEARARARDEEVLADLASGGPARRRRHVLVGFAATLAVGLGILVLLHLGLSRRESRERRQAQIVAQFAAFTEQACACQDAACTKQVSDAVSEWGQHLAKEAGFDDKPEPKLVTQIQALAERMGKCMVRTMTDGQP